MHEIGLAEDLLKKILQKAHDMGLEKVSCVKANVGETLLVHPEEMDLAFEMKTKGTIAEGAKLELNIKKLVARCAKCKTDFSGKSLRMDCPKCGSSNIEIASGRELEIKEIS